MAGALTPSGATPVDVFRSVFDAHFIDVWSYARRRCASSADADDVAAETFAVAWRRRDDLPPGQERLWLFGVARRVLANQRRGAGRREDLHVRLIHHEGTAGSLDGHDGGDGPEGKVWEALASLSADDRELLLLRAWDGLAVSDIAVLLECSANAASLRLRRARAHLREALPATDDGRSRTRAGRPPTEEGEAP